MSAWLRRWKWTLSATVILIAVVIWVATSPHWERILFGALYGVLYGLRGWRPRHRERLAPPTPREPRIPCPPQCHITAEHWHVPAELVR